MVDSCFCVSFVTNFLTFQNTCFNVITMSVCEMLAVSTSIQRADVFFSFYFIYLVLNYDIRQWISSENQVFVVCLFLIKTAHFSETSVEIIHILTFYCLFSKSFPHRTLPDWVSILPQFLLHVNKHACLYLCLSM